MTGALVQRFPTVGPRMSQAFHDLFRAETAKRAEEVADLGPLDLLPRPWDVSTIPDPDLRTEVWEWLDAVVAWLNTAYVWDTSDLIPACWPQHPHLVHELGVVAEQRRRAGLAFTSDPLEDWHRFCLPSFIDRMRARYRGYCDDGHRPAPGVPRLIRYSASAAGDGRRALYEADVAVTTSSKPNVDAVERPRFRVIDGMLVDTTTGQIADDPGQ